MGSIPRCPLCSNYLVFSKNNSYFVGIKTLLKRDIIKFVAFDINLVPLIKWGSSTVGIFIICIKYENTLMLHLFICRQSRKNIKAGITGNAHLELLVLSGKILL